MVMEGDSGVETITHYMQATSRLRAENMRLKRQLEWLRTTCMVHVIHEKSSTDLYRIDTWGEPQPAKTFYTILAAAIDSPAPTGEE